MKFFVVLSHEQDTRDVHCPQALKEGTFTAEYKLADGFLVRGEYRRDWSNQPCSRWDILLYGSIINRFLDEVRDATVQVVPLGIQEEYTLTNRFRG